MGGDGEATLAYDPVCGSQLSSFCLGLLTGNDSWIQRAKAQ